ncbi:MAG: T9SS type A sorting domain-containing protein [Candidatus Eisenbacteria bacterium]|uniref:T9SS type A sorting domain-containing protein n=1 Tax=Eiseniibacteriota bacterium TaxID=2212470 RepID=A0A849SGG3_UNCEI|nr:T9SS type A sorting domain-containing protein [Candidatus Eisenbacteria bacterium]
MRFAPPLRVMLALCSLLATAAPAAFAAGPLTSGTVVSGTIAGPTFTETWTFSGSNGQRVLISAVTTSGAPNTSIVLRAPGGTVTWNSSADRLDFQLTANGTWTVEISDVGLNDAGGYSIGFVNLTIGPYTSGGDLDGGAIVSAEIKTGSNAAIGDFDVFTFSGTAGQRIAFAAVETSAASYNTVITIYPPGGGNFEASVNSNRLDHQLLATGTYTAVVEDFANDHTGTYTLSYLNVTAGPFTIAGDLDGGPIASNEIKTGTVSGVGDMDAFTFSGTSGQRVLFVGVATGGAMNSQLWLYPAGGGPPIYISTADRADVQLNATGTWTALIEDAANDQGGNYSVSFMNVSAGPFTSVGDLDGGAIVSAEIKTGNNTGIGDIDAFTFSGVAGQRIAFAAVETSAASYNTVVTIYPPGGGNFEASVNSNRLDHQLLATGTYTAVVEDFANDHTGTYTLSYLNVTAGPFTIAGDLDGGPIASNEIKTGTVSGVGDMDAFTFSGTTGQRVLFVDVATGGAMNSQLWLYPAGGGPPIYVSSADRADVQLNATGTWTALIEDAANDQGGSYSVSFMNVSAGPFTSVGDLDGGAIVSAEIKTGNNTGIGDIDAFTFSGTAGQRIAFAAVETSAASYNTVITIYPPGGGNFEASVNSNRLDHQLLATGTYTAVVEDFANDHTGTYTLSYLNVTAGPFTIAGDLDGGPIASNEIKTGTVSGVGDMDAFTFSGTSGQRVLFVGVATGGAMNSQLWLYPAGGGPPIYVSSADRADVQLNATGTWTALIEDAANDESGSYSVSLMNVSAGPHTSGGDLDGGAIVSGGTRLGNNTGVGDFDAYTFTGTLGQRVVFSAVETSAASYNTVVTIYPPGGGNFEASVNSNRLDHQLLATGTYTAVVEDFAGDHTGTYNLAFVNVTTGIFTSATDPNGGVVTSGAARSGSISPIGDLDVYSFHGTSGQTAQIGAVTTSGLLNTEIWIYPPGGGPATVATSTDNVSYPLTATGYHMVMIEDAGLNDTGNYNFTLSGTLTNVDIPEGPIALLDPIRVVMRPPFPNPFARDAALTYSLPARLPVRMRIFDLQGALVRTLVDGMIEPGVRTASWDGSNDRGERMVSGVYFAELTAGGETVRHKLVRMR